MEKGRLQEEGACSSPFLSVCGSCEPHSNNGWSPWPLQFLPMRILFDPVCSFSSTCKDGLIIPLGKIPAPVSPPEIRVPGTLGLHPSTEPPAPTDQSPLFRVLGPSFGSYPSLSSSETPVSVEATCPLVSEETSLPFLENLFFNSTLFSE